MLPALQLRLRVRQSRPVRGKCPYACAASGGSVESMDATTGHRIALRPTTASQGTDMIATSTSVTSGRGERERMAQRRNAVRGPAPGRRMAVTGVAGFIGSHVAEALLDTGAEVVGIDAFVGFDGAAHKHRNLAGLIARPGFTFHELDLREAALDSVLDGVDTVVHEAALAGLPTSWSDVDAYVRCNVTATSRLIEACQRRGVSRFVQASTSSVYGRDAVGDETQETRPISPYGVSKLAAENLVQAHVVINDFPATILRYFSIYGPRQRPDMAYQIFIESLRSGRPLTVFGDGRQSRSNTYVGDCVDGTIRAIDGGHVGEVYNLGGGVTLELLEAIDIIARALDVQPRITHAPARPGDQRVTSADFSKAWETFGYRPRVMPMEGLANQVRWVMEEDVVKVA